MSTLKENIEKRYPVIYTEENYIKGMWVDDREKIPYDLFIMQQGSYTYIGNKEIMLENYPKFRLRLRDMLEGTIYNIVENIFEN